MNEKENVVIDDFDFSMIADFFKRVDRQGPGGDWETRLAASLIPDFKRKIRKEEIAYYEENKEYFGYVFNIGRKV